MPAIDTQAIAKRHKDKLQYAIAYLKRNPDADVKEIKDAIYENFGHDIVKRSYEIHCIAQMAIDQMKNLPLFSELGKRSKNE